MEEKESAVDVLDNEEHKEIKDSLSSIEDRLASIEKAIEPIIDEHNFRRRLDDKVTRWLPRVPYIVMVIGAILWYAIEKTGGR